MSLINSYRFAQSDYDLGNALNLGNFPTMKVLSNSGSSTEQHTISFWIKPKIVSALLPGTVLAKQNVTNRYLYVREGYVRQKWGTGVVQHTTPIMIAQNKYHIFLTRDFTNYRLWFNGVESISGTVQGVSSRDGYNMFGANNNSEYLDAEIDDLYYLKGVVGTEQNAQDIYNNGFGADPSIVMGSNGFYFFDFNTETGNQTPINKGSAGGITAVDFPISGNYVPF